MHRRPTCFCHFCLCSSSAGPSRFFCCSCRCFGPASSTCPLRTTNPPRNNKIIFHLFFCYRCEKHQQIVHHAVGSSDLFHNSPHHSLDLPRLRRLQPITSVDGGADHLWYLIGRAGDVGRQQFAGSSPHLHCQVGQLEYFIVT